MGNDPRFDLCRVLLACLCVAGAAHAHTFKCFALAEGRTVTGYAYFGGGDRPKALPYKVTGPDGTVLHEGTTTDEGEFSFVATRRCDHTITVDAGSGHVARYTLPADELPADLGGPGAETPSAVNEHTTPTPANAAPPTAAAASAAAVEAAVARAVSSQIAPLRRELNELREKQRFQDVLGGIGYLIGAAGIAFYFLGVRRRESAGAAGAAPDSGGSSVS